MADIVITEFMDLDGVETLRKDFDTLYDPDLVDKPDALAAALADCRGLVVRNRTQVRPALLAQAPKLKVVGRLGVGLDNIDLAACRARGVPVLPATGTNNKTVAEFTLAAILTLARGGAYGATAEVLAGKWPRTKFRSRDINGLRLGLIGFGAIARDVAMRAKAFELSLAAFDPYLPASDPAWAKSGVRKLELDALLATSDIISIHTPLTEATRHLLNQAAIARMPAGAFVVNTARGGIIDETALIAALKDGKLGGAFLDVMQDEPVKTASHFEGVPNLYLTPHIGGITQDAVLRASMLIADNVRFALTGAPTTVADAAAG